MTTDSSQSRGFFTLPELLVAIVIATLAAAILLPAFSPREPCCPHTCISNLKRLGLAMMMYVQDYDECYPSYRPDPRRDWSVELRNPDGQSFRHLQNSSPWVAQLLPYVATPGAFYCPQDTNPERNHTSTAVPGSATPFPVSYGPNLFFVNPTAYGRKRPVALAGVVRPEERYLLADCVTASGFDLDTIAYIRYPNYDPSLRQNGWYLDQFTALGRVAWPDQEVTSVTRHKQGSNVVFADGHTKWLRHDRIPNNDGPHGREYPRLKERMVPWQRPASDE